MELIEKNEAIRISSGYCHYTNIPKELEKLEPVKAIPIESLGNLLKGMRINIGSQSKEIESIYGNGTGWRDYSVGYISAISFIEGWLAEQGE